jgi:MtN3 and saliva related transmembrane protein
MTLDIAIGLGASIFTAVSSLPQLVKLIKEKRADNISALMFCVLLTGLGLWIYYGFLRNDWILICSNACSFLINMSVLVLAIKYKRNDSE